MNEVLTTKNPTTFAIVLALPLALLVATISTWVLLTHLHSSMTIAVSSWFGVFVCCYAVSLLANTRRYVFNERTRRIEVTDYWLVVFEGRHKEYAFDDVREIRMRTNEMSNVVLTLNTGEKLNPKTGRPAVVRKLCVRIAEAVGKSQVLPGRWK